MIIHGDCIDKMREMGESSIDAIVTDPPYMIGFMSKAWDAVPDYQSWAQAWATEAFRVLKPGGSLLSFGGTRTFHRLTCGLEDVGFIIKDVLCWLYGSGFPKAQDLGKMIDKRLGAEREVVGVSADSANRQAGGIFVSENEGERDVTAPATSLAQHWDGYKIGGIKPAWEPIIWAVKPPDGTWIDNVLKYGVGAVNVDECRIEASGESFHRSVNHTNINEGWDRPWRHSESGEARDRASRDLSEAKAESLGRFPANLILDEEAGEMLDEQSGVSSSEGGSTRTSTGDGYGFSEVDREHTLYHDTGGASRFFYCAKASKREREKYNDHPTLKPVKLMEYLVRLVTRPGQLVLDPFAGSGTTGVACIKSGREFLLIEQDEHYVDIAEQRLDESQAAMF